MRYAPHTEDIIPLYEDILPESGGLITMLKVYLDLGAKKESSDGVVTVASVVYRPTSYKQFVRPWKRMLRAWGAPAFHATDFYNGAAEFKRDTAEKQRLFEADSKRIPEMVAKHAQYMLAVSFRPDEFHQVAPKQWKEHFGTSVHSLAVQLALIANGWWRYEKCRNERFAYFMESGDTDEGEVLKTVERMRHDVEGGTSEVIRVSAFTPVDKGMAKGIEASDFIAWHWNKYYMDKIRHGKEMEPRKDFRAFSEVARKKFEFIFATGETLRYFFSLVPPQVFEKS